MLRMDETTAMGLLELAEDLAPATARSDAKPALDRLEARDTDLGAAIDWFVDAGRAEEALRLANAMYRYWISTRRLAGIARSLGRSAQPAALIAAVPQTRA